MTGDRDIAELQRGHLKGVTLHRVEAGEVPEPYRGLLCHERDMTSTLARFHGGEVALVVLNEEVEGDFYVREVLLEVGGKPVEYGVIRIFLGRFPVGVRSEIELGGRPLGGILNESGMRYVSRPLGFLKVAGSEFAPDFFPTDDSKFRFGRYNELLGEDEEVLARIIEILPTEKP